MSHLRLPSLASNLSLSFLFPLRQRHYFVVQPDSDSPVILAIAHSNAVLVTFISLLLKSRARTQGRKFLFSHIVSEGLACGHFVPCLLIEYHVGMSRA